MRCDCVVRSRRVRALAIGAVMTAGVAVAAQAPLVTRGAATCRAVALTFDLCPVNEGDGFDRELVAFLIKNRVHATFFASGRWIATHDAAMRELTAQPFFEIGTHGQAHAHMKTLTRDAQVAEIRGAVSLLAERYGISASLFRPPYGEYNDDTLAAAETAGQSIVMWSVVSGDPDPKLTAAAITEDVASRARNGSVIIFHANGRGWRTKDTVPAVYQRVVTGRGLAALTVSELRNGCRPVTH